MSAEQQQSEEENRKSLNDGDAQLGMDGKDEAGDEAEEDSTELVKLLDGDELFPLRRKRTKFNWAEVDDADADVADGESAGDLEKLPEHWKLFAKKVLVSDKSVQHAIPQKGAFRRVHADLLRIPASPFIGTGQALLPTQGRGARRRRVPGDQGDR